MSNVLMRHVENVIIVASSVARKNDSAMLCYNDSVKMLQQGKGEFAIKRALRSISHATGRNSIEYKEAISFAEPYCRYHNISL